MSDDKLKEWTIMIYMAGDNNLGADMATALKDIKDVARNSKNSNVLVYYDSVSPDAPTLYFDFSEDEKTFSVSTLVRHPINSPSIITSLHHPTNEDSASATSLLNFINWCVNDTTDNDGKNTHIGKRAVKYSLILSGHSSAFKDLSLLSDMKAGNFMTISQLTETLRKITDPKGNFLKQPIDILGFDSCTMGMLELAYQVKPYSKTMIASQGNVPKSGWTYGSILSKLQMQTPQKDTKELAKDFVEDFINKENEYLIGGVSVDLSAWDLGDSVDRVVTSVNNFAKQLNLILAEDTDTSLFLIRAIRISHLECQSYLYEQNIDTKDFCQELISEIVRSDPSGAFTAKLSGIIFSCKKVIDSIYDCIQLCGFSGGKYQYSNGVSLFFPWTKYVYQSSIDAYKSLLINKENKLKDWNEFLEKFITDTTLRKKRQLVDQIPSPNDPHPFPGNVVFGHGITPISNLAFYTFKAREDNFVNQDNIAPDEDTKDNPLIPRVRNNPLIPRDRGFEESLEFKNIDTQWNWSGFTKKIRETKPAKSDGENM